MGLTSAGATQWAIADRIFEAIKIFEENFSNKNHEIYESGKKYLGQKQCNVTLHQMKVDIYEDLKIAAKYKLD